MVDLNKNDKIRDNISEALEEVEEQINKEDSDDSERAYEVLREVYHLRKRIERLQNKVEEADSRSQKAFELIGEVEKSIEEEDKADVNAVRDQVEKIRADLNELGGVKNLADIKKQSEQIIDNYSSEELDEKLKKQEQRLEEVENKFGEAISSERISKAEKDIKLLQENKAENKTVINALKNLKNALDKQEELVENLKEVKQSKISKEEFKKKVSQIEDNLEGNDEEIREEILELFEGYIERQEFEELRGDVNAVLEENDRVNENIKQFKKDIDNEIDDIEHRIKNLAIEEKVDQSNFKQQLQEIRGDQLLKFSEIQDKLQSIKIEEKVDKNDLESKIEDLKQEMRLRVIETESKLYEVTAKKKQLQKTNENISELEEDHDGTKEALEKAQEDLETLQNNLEELSQEVKGLENELSQFEIDEKVDIEDLNEKVTKLQQSFDLQIKHTENEIRKQHATKSELKQVWESLEILRNTDEDIEKQVANVDQARSRQKEMFNQRTEYINTRISVLRKDLEEVREKQEILDTLAKKERVSSIEDRLDEATNIMAEKDRVDALENDLSELSGVVAKEERLSDLESKVSEMSDLLLKVAKKL